MRAEPLAGPKNPLVAKRASAATMTLFVAVSLAILGQSAGAQSQYFNLDGGRPTRIEDAEPTAFRSLDIDFAPFRVDRAMGGTMRYRAEPKLEYGIAPFTDLEIRVPVVRVQPSQGRSVTGAAGISIGAMHAFNLETTSIPALALSAEWSLPAGQLSGTQGAYLARALATKTTRIGRFHVNVGAGTYSVRVNPTAATQCLFNPFETTDANGCSSGIPVVIDAPCDVATRRPVLSAREDFSDADKLPSRACMAAQPAATSAPASSPSTITPKSFGAHYLGGIGFDHAFPLQSTLVAMDVFAEHFEGLYARPDMNAEVGVRRQLTPTVVFQGGIARKFAGAVPTTSLIFGATYEIPTPAWRGAR